MNESRYESRQPVAGQFSLTWKDRQGREHTATAAGVDLSRSGIGLECPDELKHGAIVHLQAADNSIRGECEVVYCTRWGAGFRIGLEFREALRRKLDGPAAEPSASSEDPDYYETLQISRNADTETIHRVFRIMAVRFHPDNPETGDVEQFLRMKRAYAVLSDPQRRAEYNATLEASREDGPRPVFRLKRFVTGVEAEENRRLGVLSLLYNQRQMNPDKPGVSLLDLEREMGFPREYLAFTTWYLRAKDMVNVAENSDYTITAAGADYVEKEALGNEIINKLLNPATARSTPSAKAVPGPRRSAIGSPRKFLLPAAPL